MAEVEILQDEVAELARLAGAEARVRRVASGDCHASFNCQFELRPEVIDQNRHRLDEASFGVEGACLDDAAAAIESGELDELVEMCIRARPHFLLSGGRLEIYRCDGRDDESACFSCNGIGQMDCEQCPGQLNDDQTCPACSGTQKQVCSHCDGSGRVTRHLYGTVVAERTQVSGELRLPEDVGSGGLLLDPGLEWLLSGWKPNNENVGDVGRGACTLRRPMRWARVAFALELGGKSLRTSSALLVMDGERRLLQANFCLDAVLARWSRLVDWNARIEAGNSPLGRALIAYEHSGVGDELLSRLMQDEALSFDNIGPAASSLADADSGAVRGYWLTAAVLAPLVAVASATYGMFTWFGLPLGKLFGFGAVVAFAAISHLLPLVIAGMAGDRWRQPSAVWVRQSMGLAAVIALTFPGLIFLGFHI